MAFNPFTSFRKYQKFWMATILLLCMITFVLCTGGPGGDLSDRVLALFSNRKGQAVARVNGYSVYRKDLEDLRIRRNIADLFMIKASRLAIDRLTERLKNTDKIPEAQRRQVILLWEGMKKDLHDRLSRPRYFTGGVKYDDLINFMLWQQEADRLGITLDQEGLRVLVFQAVYGRASIFDDVASREVQIAVRSSNHLATDDAIYRALRDEYRVQIAQLALMEARPDRIFNPPGGYPAFVRDAGGPLRNISFPPQMRRPLAPEELWEDYRKQCAEFDVALVPVPVDDFQKDIPAPTEAQLQDLYERNRENDFNPTADLPSFKYPPRMKVQWVSADPESPFYRKLSRAVTTLERTPAVDWTPLLPAPLAAAHYASQSAAWDASLQVNYEHLKRQNMERYLAPPLTAPNFLLELASRELAGGTEKTPPATVAALVGSAAQPGLAFAAPLAFQADIYFRHQKELPLVLPALAKPRVPLAASMVLAGASSELLPIGMWAVADAQPQFLPLDLVRDELRKKIELNLAERWTVRNMLEVKKALETPGTPGNKEAMERRLAELVEPYGLEVKTTEHFHNRYDIAQAPSLQPLLRSFELYRNTINTTEGRGGTPLMLKEDDFWRLFFDSSIGFSVENAGRYVAKPWPPDVKAKATPFGTVNVPSDEGRIIPLFEESGHPFLFWQTEFEPARLPKSLDEVRDKVVYAWKHLQARDKLALPRARAIAEALQRAGKDRRLALAEEAAKLGHEVITLRGVAPLVPLPRTNPREAQAYGPYQLPKDLFVYPREDTVKNFLLPLTKLSADSKEAIKTGNRDLDDLNESLLKRKLADKQVQVYTNKPRSVYYVGVVVNAPEPSRAQFVLGVYGAAGRNMIGDGFVEYCQEEAGKAYENALVNQLRKAAEVDDSSFKEAKASFDGEAGASE